MTRLLAIALLSAAVLGCKKEEKGNFAPDKNPAPVAGPDGPKNTNFVPGGGMVTNVKNAVKRTVVLTDMHALGIFITAMDLENNKMPTTEAVVTALKADPSQKKLLEIIDEGAIKLTGTTNRSGLWAYEIDSEKKGGIGLVGGTASRMTADEIKPLLQGN